MKYINLHNKCYAVNDDYSHMYSIISLVF